MSNRPGVASGLEESLRAVGRPVVVVDVAAVSCMNRIWGRDESVLQRYDDIFASWPDFRVKEVPCLRDRARAAGSDYAS